MYRTSSMWRRSDRVLRPALIVDGGRARLLMVGDFTYAPNRSGRDLLVVDSAARLGVPARGPADDRGPRDGRLARAGRADRGSRLRRGLGVLYARSDCVVVPITEGAGSPLKFVEALAYGVPVVATPKAAKGLEVFAGVHFREGKDAATLARQSSRSCATGEPRWPRGARDWPSSSTRSSPSPSASPHDRAPPMAGPRCGDRVGRRHPFVLCYHGVGTDLRRWGPARPVHQSRDLRAPPRSDRQGAATLW